MPEVRNLPDVALVVEPLVEDHVEEPAPEQHARGEKHR
jgi:hypothetical protein